MLDTKYTPWALVLGVAAMLGCGAAGSDSAGGGGSGIPGGGGLAEGSGGLGVGTGGQVGSGASRAGGASGGESGGGASSAEGGHAESALGGGGSSALGGRAGTGASGAGGSGGTAGHAGIHAPDGGGRSAAGGHAASGAQNTGGSRADAGPQSDSGNTGGSGFSGDSGSDTDPCAGGTTYEPSTSSNTTVSGYGWVLLYGPTDNNNKIVEFSTTMIVPAKPPASGTLFLWPGLQPRQAGANFKLLDNGVLQPVLTWGPTCAPGAPANSYKSWWISGQYVNTYISSSNSNYSAYNGCHGGPGMDVEVGDSLDMRFALSGTDWTQTVTNRRNSKSVSYTIDMLGQAQSDAEFVIEEYSSKPLSDVIFTSSVVTFSSAAPSSCRPLQRGKNDYFTAPRSSADGRTCCIAKIVLRSEGVDPTSPNSP